MTPTTPGPWQLTDQRNWHGRGPVFIDGPDGRHIACLLPGHPDLDANARLLLAAPNMLAAIDGLLTALAATYDFEQLSQDLARAEEYAITVRAFIGPRPT